MAEDEPQAFNFAVASRGQDFDFSVFHDHDQQSAVSKVKGKSSNKKNVKGKPGKISSSGSRKRKAGAITTTTENVNSTNYKKRIVAKPAQIASTLMSKAELTSYAQNVSHGNNNLFDITQTFDALNLHPDLVRTLTEKMNLSQPTRIQTLAIPHIRSGRDALIKSITGSGKTLCFLLPIIQSLCSATPGERCKRSDGTLGLLLSPTRELCLQIYLVLEKLAQRFPYIVIGHIMGGERKKSEKARLRKGVNVLVATPGRLLDHLEGTQAFNVKNLRWLVLDEADRLLDMGFEKSLTKILQLLDRNHQLGSSRNIRRQNVLISATLEKTSSLAAMVLLDPVQVGFENKDTKTNDPAFALPEHLQHQYVLTENAGNRIVALGAMLHWKTYQAATISSSSSSSSSNKASGLKGMVFVSTCDSVDFHTDLFSRAYWPDVEAGGSTNTANDDEKKKQPLLKVPLYKLHGNLPQKTRTATWREFHSCKNGILFCTDVAARGLDLPAVDFIVQYDPPEQEADYVHRAGRTARMGRTGWAVIFLNATEVDYLSILRDLNIELSHLPVSTIFRTLEQTSRKTKVKYGQARVSPGQVLKKQMMDIVSSNITLTNLGTAAFRSYCRAYAAYPKHIKYIFHPKKLHLGKVASSFALTGTPSVLGKNAERIKKTAKEEEQQRKKKQAFVGKVAASTVNKYNETAVKGPNLHSSFNPMSEFG